MTQGMVIAEAVRRHYQEVILWTEWLAIYENNAAHAMTLIAENKIQNHRRAMVALWDGYESCMI